MNNFLGFVTKYGEQMQLFLFAGFLLAAWNIEIAAGMIVHSEKRKHALKNMPFIFTNIPGQFLLGLAFVKTIRFTSAHHFGVLYLFHFHSTILIFLLSFIMLDFGEYIYHVIMHKVKRLWMVHAVHHSDEILDASTTLREHPFENFVRLSFTLLWVFCSGTMFWALMLRQIIQTFTTVVAHLNYRLPAKADRIIGWVFITPNLHQVHHHYQQPYTDSNYGDVFSIWDRLFGTFKRMPAKNLVFGVDTYMQTEDIGSFKTIFKIPFGSYRLSKTNQAKIIELTPKNNAAVKVTESYL